MTADDSAHSNDMVRISSVTHAQKETQQDYSNECNQTFSFPPPSRIAIMPTPPVQRGCPPGSGSAFPRSSEFNSPRGGVRCLLIKLHDYRLPGCPLPRILQPTRQPHDRP